MCALKHFRIKLKPLYAGGGYKNSTKIRGQSKVASDDPHL